MIFVKKFSVSQNNQLTIRANMKKKQPQATATPKSTLSQRLKMAVSHLKGRQIIKTQKEIADKIGESMANLSYALNGVRESKTVAKKFAKAFSNTFNEEWIMLGKGQMLKYDVMERFREYLSLKGPDDLDRIETPMLEYFESQKPKTIGEAMKILGKPASEKKFAKHLSKKYTDINPEWLLTGKGTRLKMPAVKLSDVLLSSLDVETYGADILIIIDNPKLLPKYRKGDMLACKIVGKLDINTNFQSSFSAIK